jgi:hypothetical protein
VTGLRRHDRLSTYDELTVPNIEQRWIPGTFPTLPDLPVPEEFRQVFRDWAEGKVNFVGPAPDSADSGSR